MSNSNGIEFSDSKQNSLRKEGERRERKEIMEEAIKNETGLKITELAGTSELKRETLLKVIEQKFKQQTGLPDLVLLSTLDDSKLLDVIKNILKSEEKNLDDQEINFCKEDFQNQIKELKQNSKYNSQDEFKKTVNQFNLLISVLDKHINTKQFKQQTGLPDLALFSALDDEKLCGVIQNILKFYKKNLDDQESFNEIIKEFRNQIKELEQNSKYNSQNELEKIIDQFNLLVSALDKHINTKQFKQQTGLSELILLSTLEDSKLLDVIKNILKSKEKTLDDQEINFSIEEFRSQIEELEKNKEYNSQSEFEKVIDQFNLLASVLDKHIAIEEFKESTGLPASCKVYFDQKQKNNASSNLELNCKPQDLSDIKEQKNKK